MIELQLPDPPLAWPGGVLRSWDISDAPQLLQAWEDPDVVAFNDVPEAPNTETARRWIQGEQARLERGVSIDLAIVADAGSEVVGEVGLSGFDDRYRGALIGYWLLPEARGRGVATEAVRCMLRWAHEVLELATIIARCHQDNVASQHVAARCGMVNEAVDATGHQLWRSVVLRD